jgi:hypothetical protein
MRYLALMALIVLTVMGVDRGKPDKPDEPEVAIASVAPVPALIGLGLKVGNSSQTPKNILGTNCAADFIACQGITLGAGGGVSAWTDQCNNVTISQATQANQPNYTAGECGQASVDFVLASSLYLGPTSSTYTLSAGWEAFGVVKNYVRVGVVNNQFWWILASSLGMAFENNANNQWTVAFNQNGPVWNSTTTGPVVVDSIETSGTNVSLALNGSQSFVTGNPLGALPSSATLTLGRSTAANQYANGSLQEVVFSKVTVTGTQLTALQQYFSNTYGVP